MEKKDNLPAVDDENIRALNTKRVVKAVDNIGDFVKTYQKEKRISMITGIIMFFIFVGIIVGGFVYMDIKTEGNFFETILDTDTTANRFVCHNSDENLTFRFPEHALQFKELFPNASCTYYSTKK